MIEEITPLDLLRLAQTEFRRFNNLADQGRMEMYSSARMAQELVAEAADRMQSGWLAESEPCLDCDKQGRYPSGAICKSCEGACRVPKGSNGGVIAY